MTSQQARRRWGRHRERQLLVVVVLAVLTAACGGGPSDDAGRTATSTSASGEAATGELVYFAPEPLPKNSQVMSASISHGAAPGTGSSAVVLGRPDGDAHVGVVRALASPASDGQDPSTFDDASPVDIGGVDGFALDNPATGAYVSWLDRSWLVTVVGPAGEAELVLEVARAVELADDGAVRLRNTPAGYVEVASFVSAAGEATSNWSLSLKSTEGDSSLISIHGSLVSAGVPAAMMVIGDRLTAISVRDKTAAVAERTVSYPGQSVDVVLRSLAWLERPDLAITISGTGSRVDVEELVDLAESLRQIDEATFKSLQAEHDQPSAPETTRL